MFQGTASDVGKSLIVTGIARALANRGFKVRPFKPQNMSNNAAVAAAYQRMKPDLAHFVLDSYARLKADADIVLVEGAGSASEVNLRQHDIANMGFARAADVPVVLIGDIDRGGVIASLVGTKTVLDPRDAGQIRGFLVNKFRGDPQLFADGMATIERVTGWEALGVVPFFSGARLLPAEDALALEGTCIAKPKARIRIAVPILPHVANFDDLDPLEAEPAVDLVRLRPGNAVPGDADLVILLGAKATVADLAALRDAGFHIDIAAHSRRGGSVLGLCGGYQMLGRTIRDPLGLEGRVGVTDGLGLLDVETILTAEKRLERVCGTTCDGIPFSGYEMHMGLTEGPDCARAFARLSNGSSEGAVSPSGRVMGTYIHGLFTDDRQRSAWLQRFAAGQPAVSYDALIDETLDRLAEHLAAHIDIDRLLSLSR
jgi:adenosylcobyric acid synthase